MRIDVMTDIETLGTSVDSSIIQIAACAFDIETGKISSKFNRIINISTIENLKVDGDTIKWWLKTDKELMNRLLNSGSAAPFIIALRDFHSWFYSLVKDNNTDNLYLWGNGILFDNAMLKYQFESQGFNYPISYRNDRDMRTIVELACVRSDMNLNDFNNQFNDEGLVKHDAFDDVSWQIKVVSHCWNLLTKN